MKHTLVQAASECAFERQARRYWPIRTPMHGEAGLCRCRASHYSAWHTTYYECQAFRIVYRSESWTGAE